MESINKYYIYSFWNKNNEIIYIGKAENLLHRLKGHNHLPNECYEQIKVIKYYHVKNPVLMDLFEIILINAYQPFFNIQNKHEIKWFKKIREITIQNEINWIELNDFILKDLKFNKSKSIQKEAAQPQLKQYLTEEEIKEEIKRRQREGIERAKLEGKYKGRKEISFSDDDFYKAYNDYANRKITKAVLAERLGISRPTLDKILREKGLMKNKEEKNNE